MKDRENGRDSLKIQNKFRDWLKYDVINSTFPIKNMNVLAVIATRIWIKKFLAASSSEKVTMIKEVIKERQEAEDAGHLHNSRPIDEGVINENEDEQHEQ